MRCYDREQFLPFEESFGITAFECDGKTISVPDKQGDVKAKRLDWLLVDGCNEIKVISVANEAVRPYFSGYVKVGKTIENQNWSVRLHYGKT